MLNYYIPIVNFSKRLILPSNYGIANNRKYLLYYYNIHTNTYKY